MRRIGPVSDVITVSLAFQAAYWSLAPFWFGRYVGETVGSYEAISLSVMVLTLLVSIEHLALVSSDGTGQCASCACNHGPSEAAGIIRSTIGHIATIGRETARCSLGQDGGPTDYQYSEFAIAQGVPSNEGPKKAWPSTVPTGKSTTGICTICSVGSLSRESIPRISSNDE